MSADGRLERLYEISKLLLAGFDDVERTFSAVLASATLTLPLGSAILIEASGGSQRVVSWRAEGHRDEGLAQAMENAQAAYAYFLGAGTSERRLATELAPIDRRRFIVMPLVAPRRPVFGALQLEGTSAFAKEDLIFVNAVANQLAIALDRHHAWEHDVALRERAEEAARIRDRVLGVVSHDLRNPLSAILLALKSLRAPALAEERRTQLPKTFERIHRSALRMERLIGDLLDFAGIQGGTLTLSRAPCEPATIVADAVAAFEPLAQEEGLRLEGKAVEGLPKVTCDRDRILQVFSNLIGNAIKVSPAGSSITLRAEANDEEVLFAVADQGPGITAEDLPRLFDNYWRGSDPGYAGTGMGLSIVRGIVEAHGGRVWAESVLGQGATLIFTLPVAPPA